MIAQAWRRDWDHITAFRWPGIRVSARDRPV
jgi:hypothetical protein